MSHILSSQSTDFIFVDNKGIELGELNPSSSTRRKTSTQYSQPGSQTRGTGTGQNVRRRSVTERVASSSGGVSRATAINRFILQVVGAKVMVVGHALQATGVNWIWLGKKAVWTKLYAYGICEDMVRCADGCVCAI